MKYFVTSDIHGHYSVLIELLNTNGYDENNTNHKLIVCGDMFDRGLESLEVYKYLKRLKSEEKAIIVFGNHDNMLKDVLTNQTRVKFNIEHNGLGETIKSFYSSVSDKEINLEDLEDCKKVINEGYPELIEWLEDLPLFYELENYIFVHAGLNCDKEVDWRTETDERTFIWTKKFHLDEFDTNHIDKTIVCGHYRTSEMDAECREGEYGFYKKINKIFIDANVEESGQLNCLILEEG